MCPHFYFDQTIKHKDVPRAQFFPGFQRQPNTGCLICHFWHLLWSRKMAFGLIVDIDFPKAGVGAVSVPYLATLDGARSRHELCSRLILRDFYSEHTVLPGSSHSVLKSFSAQRMTSCFFRDLRGFLLSPWILLFIFVTDFNSSHPVMKRVDLRSEM